MTTNKNLLNGVIKSEPRKWTDDDIKLLLELKSQKDPKISNDEIAEILKRTPTSVAIKYKRIHKKDGSYNNKHVIDKYATNDEFIKEIKPKSLLDVYAWDKYYSKFDIPKYVTNDKDIKADTDYHLEAFEFIAQFYNKKFDIVDLDPFGSSFECFDLAIKISQKWLIITLWEIWHKRWKRLDFVKDRYGITDVSDDWFEKIVDYIIKRWKIFKKTLTPIYVKDWNNIWRVYFKVEKYKETSQWDKKDEKLA